MSHAMNGMMGGGMIWGMGLIGLLLIILLILAIAALIKYLFFGFVLALMAAAAPIGGPAMAQQANAQRGAQAFRVCATCHSLEPDKNMTGPSLAGVFGRKSGTLPSFDRYSPALKSAQVTWAAKSMDSWLADPVQFIPGNHMTFPGIKDARARADLIAFLEKATAPGAAPPAMAQGGGMGGMGGMGGGAVPNLKHESPAQHVTAIRYCRDSYHVITADGETHDFWERNLRLKTDSSDDGPPKDAPALVRAGMMGDRGDIIFASPEGISGMIKHECR